MPRTWKPMKTLMKSKLIIPLLLLICTARDGVVRAAPSDQSEVRSAVQRIFDQLKGGEYEALYDSLPSSTRSRVPRDRFVKGLQGTRNMYQLQRIEIGIPRVAGKISLLDTTTYADIQQTFDCDGQLGVQQYLVREDGSWRGASR